MEKLRVEELLDTARSKNINHAGRAVAPSALSSSGK
jgi:hypothetical protein